MRVVDGYTGEKPIKGAKVTFRDYPIGVTRLPGERYTNENGEAILPVSIYSKDFCVQAYKDGYNESIIGGFAADKPQTAVHLKNGVLIIPLIPLTYPYPQLKKFGITPLTLGPSPTASGIPANLITLPPIQGIANPTAP